MAWVEDTDIKEMHWGDETLKRAGVSTSTEEGIWY